MLGNRSRWLLLFAGWSLFGGVQALTDTVLVNNSGEALVNLVAFYLPLAWMWAALTPVVGLWSRAMRRRFPSLALRVAAHLPFLLAAALLHTWLRRVLIVAMGNTLNIPFEVTLLYFADLTIASYLAAVWAARVLEANAMLTAKERHTIDLKRQLVSAQMEYLELQLRPHFLFNALSTIAELAHEAPRNAARMLQNLVALLESAVARGGGGLVPLSEELDALRPYLDIQRLRFTDWLVIEEDAADDAKRALVPRFILQPLVENAVHHGLIKRTARGQIAIRARVEGERLLITVVDNGVGLNAAASYRESRGLGLANLRARLDAMYDGGASINLHDETGEARGTVARIDLPFRTTSEAQAVIPSDQTVIPSDQTVIPSDQTVVARDDRILGWAMAHPVLAVTIGWAVIALLRIQHSYAYMMLRETFTPAALTSAIRFDLTVAGLWLLMTPLVIGLARRVPLRRDRIVPRVLVHVVCAVALAYWHAGLARFISGGFQSPLWSGVPSEIYAWNIAVYAIMLAIAHARILDVWIRDRELVAQRLHKELKDAQFRRVMLELRPGVLLDTLRHLVDLVTENAKRSERILADVGDFLRATLNVIHEPSVTLREESETVRAYARVLGVASVPGLTVQLSVPLALMDEPVPNGVLRVALDAVLDNRAGETTHVRLDVSSEEKGISIHATAQSGGDQPSSWSATVTEGGSEFAAEVVGV